MKIKILVMDVDGTLTDGKIYMGNDGEVCKAFDIKDGCGIHDLLIPAGIIPVIITGRSSQILKNRCEELGIIHLYQGIKDKQSKLEMVLEETNCQYGNVAYIGDDVNDLACMQKVRAAGGVIGCPHDAALQVMEMADFVCKKNGGNGAVREFIEHILKQ
ncbi:MAG: HAD hydrolase family protein [Clostridium sp.]|nr:HAD hydrolase family protein [Clostridium sp.]